jgi:4-alpha-glucanotransferase
MNIKQDPSSAKVLPRSPAAGVALHFTSLPGPHGIGDIADSSRLFLQELQAMGLRVWQVLPTGPTAYGDSPYQPLSAFAGNEMLVGLAPLVRAGLLGEQEPDVLRRLPHGRVDYGRLIPLKRQLLELAADRFAETAGADVQADYASFRQRHGAWLEDYVLFRVLKDLHEQRPWTEWEAHYAHRDSGALEEARETHGAALERLRVIQYFFDRQWRVLRDRASTAGVRLFGDIPIYIALDSSDAWARRELLQVGDDGVPTHVAGVPPDYFSEDGQLWGNPLYDWERHRETGFAWWVERMSHAARMFDMVRIDHFRGFEAYWSVSHGAQTAREGQWIEGPGDALFEAIEAALGRLPIVAEDLGVITEEVDVLRERHGIPGMKVLQFEIGDKDFDPAEIEPYCVCYTGTHDNDTTRGWFEGSDEDTRTPEEIEFCRVNALRLTGGAPETIATDVIRLALSTRARLVVAPLQDFMGLGSEARMNIPGTTSDNWRWRVLARQLDGDFRDSVRALVKGSSR